MIQTRGYYDLCIQESFFTAVNWEQYLRSLYDYGYRTIAVNQTIDCELIANEHQPKKKKKKGDPREIQDILPEPFNIAKIKETADKLGFKNFNVFNRLTVYFANQDALYKLIKSPNFKKYHIFAAAPTTTQALTFTCGTLEADIFTFNPENKFGLHFNRKFYEQLRNRGYHVELLYASAIEDSTKRKHLIHASHLFHTYGKSRNIIFSSGASSHEYIRSPYDIISLGFIFGLSELQSKSAVSHCPNNVILNSIGRRQGKAAMFVESIAENRKPKENDDSIVILTNSSDEDMETPKLKKIKSNYNYRLRTERYFSSSLVSQKDVTGDIVEGLKQIMESNTHVIQDPQLFYKIVVPAFDRKYILLTSTHSKE